MEKTGERRDIKKSVTHVYISTEYGILNEKTTVMDDIGCGKNG